MLAQLAGGGSALPEDDEELAPLIAALTVLSGGMRNSEAAVEGERLSLEVQRVKREIEVAKAAAAGDVGRLVALRQELERRRDGAIARAIEETHADERAARRSAPATSRDRVERGDDLALEELDRARRLLEGDVAEDEVGAEVVDPRLLLLGGDVLDRLGGRAREAGAGGVPVGEVLGQHAVEGEGTSYLRHSRLMLSNHRR